MRMLELKAWAFRAAMWTASLGCAAEMETVISLNIVVLGLVDDYLVGQVLGAYRNDRFTRL
jgi:hypothetical protein